MKSLPTNEPDQWKMVPLVSWECLDLLPVFAPIHSAAAYRTVRPRVAVIRLPVVPMVSSRDRYLQLQFNFAYDILTKISLIFAYSMSVLSP